MRRIIWSAVLGVLLAVNANAAIYVMQPDGTKAAKTTLAAAATAADAAGKTVVVTSAYTISNNLTWPSDRALLFERGGRINVASSKAFNWNGGAPVGDPQYQLFGGSGTVTGLSHGNTVWFPDAQSAVTSLATSGGELVWTKGTYTVSTTITVPSGGKAVWKFLPGAEIKLANSSAMSAETPIIDLSGAHYSEIDGIVLDGNRANNSVGATAAESGGIKGIYALNTRGLKIRNFKIHDTSGRGLQLRNCPGAVVEYFEITDCGRAASGNFAGAYAQRNALYVDTNVAPSDPYYDSDSVVQYGKVTGAGTDGITYGSGGTIRNVEASYSGANFAVDPGVAGIYVRAPQIADGVQDKALVVDCHAHHNNGNGIDVGAGEGTSDRKTTNTRLIGNLSEFNGLNGFSVAGLDTLGVGNIARNNGTRALNYSGSANTRRAGYEIGTHNSALVKNASLVGNHAYDDQLVKTQQYAVALRNFSPGTATISDVFIGANTFHDNAAGVIYNPEAVPFRDITAHKQIALVGDATTGTGSTAKPELLIEPTGTTSTGWNTSGTFLGINNPSGFTGRAISVHQNGVEKFYVTPSGSSINNYVYANSFNLTALNSSPASASDTGTTGDIRFTSTYIYVCTAPNTWKRAAISTW